MITSRLEQEKKFDFYIIFGVLKCSDHLRNKINNENISLAEESYKKIQHEHNILTEMHHQIYTSQEKTSERKNVSLSELMGLSTKHRKDYEELNLANRIGEVKARWNQFRLYGKTIVPMAYVRIEVVDSTNQNLYQVFNNFDEFDHFTKTGCQFKDRHQKMLDSIKVTPVSKPRSCSVM